MNKEVPRLWKPYIDTNEKVARNHGVLQNWRWWCLNTVHEDNDSQLLNPILKLQNELFRNGHFKLNVNSTTTKIWYIKESKSIQLWRQFCKEWTKHSLGKKDSSIYTWAKQPVAMTHNDKANHQWGPNRPPQPQFPQPIVSPPPNALLDAGGTPPLD